jgi:hypothetical protein
MIRNSFFWTLFLLYTLIFGSSKQPFSISYYISGGEGGFRDTLILQDDGFIKFHGHYLYERECCHQDTVNPKYFNEIVKVVKISGFFDLNEQYGPNYHCKDGTSQTIRCLFGSARKTVLIEECTDRNSTFEIVTNKLREILRIAWPQIDCGTLYPNFISIVRKWPFSDSLPISKIFEVESSKIDPRKIGTDRRIAVKAPKYAYDKFREIENKTTLRQVYYENGYTYDLVSNDNRFEFYIISREKPVQFSPEFGINLSDIPEEGVFLEKDKLKGILDYLKRNFPKFISFSSNDNGILCSVDIVLGNHSKNMPPFDLKRFLKMKAENDEDRVGSGVQQR